MASCTLLQLAGGDWSKYASSSSGAYAITPIKMAAAGTATTVVPVACHMPEWGVALLDFDCGRDHHSCGRCLALTVTTFVAAGTTPAATGCSWRSPVWADSGGP